MVAYDSYISTYKAYKADTGRIATWLVENARRCGVEVEASLVTNRDSSTKPTKAKSAPLIYQIQLKEFTRLAEAVAASEEPKIRLPRSMVSLIETVITLRKQAAEFFAARSKAKDQALNRVSNAGHRHFISVLGQVLTILRPAANEQAGPITTQVTNLFEALSVEEPTIPEEDASTGAKAEPKQSGGPEYELEPLGEDDIFVIFSLFRDVEEFRKITRTVWDDYRHGRLDVMSASITTDTAFTLLRHSSEQIVNSLSGKQNYPSIISILNSYLDKFGGPGDTFQDWTCLMAANLLNSYEDILDPKAIPVMKPGYFGVYDPLQDRSKLTEREKNREDLIVLLELLPEFTKLSRTHLYVPAEDELTTGLRKMMDANAMSALPMYAIFGTQMLLDIHHILREDVGRPFEQLQATGRRVMGILDEYFRTSRHRTILNWPPKNDDVLRQIRAFANDWTLNDRVGNAVVTGAGKGHQRPFHLLKNHPVLSGLLVFRLNILLNDAGMNLCNAWGSIIYPAHIYNAARQSAELEEKWDDMEFVLAVHSPQRIFVGNPPREPQEYLKRFLLALGTSATAFARNRRPGGPSLIPESKKGPRGLKTTSPIKDIFWSRYVDDKTAVLSAPNVIAMMAVATKAERTSTPSVNLAGLASTVATQRQYAHQSLLLAVREGVAAAELLLLFDYFALHQRGYVLLRNLQTHLQGDMVRYFGSNYIENESELPYIVGYIFEVTAGSNRIAAELRLAHRGSEMLCNAADVLSRFLQSEDRRKSIMGAKATTDCIVYAYQNGILGR